MESQCRFDKFQKSYRDAHVGDIELSPKLSSFGFTRRTFLLYDSLAFYYKLSCFYHWRGSIARKTSAL